MSPTYEQGQVCDAMITHLPLFCCHRAHPFPPSAVTKGITHETLQAKSCANRDDPRPYWMTQRKSCFRLFEKTTPIWSRYIRLPGSAAHCINPGKKLIQVVISAMRQSPRASGNLRYTRSDEGYGVGKPDGSLSAVECARLNDVRWPGLYPPTVLGRKMGAV